MNFKKILLLPVLIFTICLSGCKIELYTPESSSNTGRVPNTQTKQGIHKINPSSYNGTISYFQGNSSKLSSEEVYKHGVTSTVYILSTTLDGLYGGSGVFFSEDSDEDGYAYIFTNAHVVKGSLSIEVVYSNHKRDTATLVGYHTLEDVAVLAVRKNNNYTITTINTTDNLSPGAEVLAIGTPVSTEYSFTATKGIISKIDSPIASAVDNDYELLLLQIDAALNQGNSGGPLFDMYGNLIGLNTMKLVYDDSYDNVDDFNFAIPIERAIFMANNFFNNIKHERGIIGVTIIDITDLPLEDRESRGITLDYGLYIESVDDNTDAINKIKKGDIITKINDVEFKIKSEFQKELYTYAKHDTIKLTIYRNGEYIEVNIALQ